MRRSAAADDRKGRAASAESRAGAFTKGCERRDLTSTGCVRLNAGVENFATPPLTVHTWRGEARTPPL
jgi:hypothetical protein